MDFKDITKVLQRWGIPGKEAGELADISKNSTVEKGGDFIREGQVPRKFAFLLKGLFRYVYLDANGHEYTKSIITESNVLCSYSAMLHKTPSYFYIQAMEESEILVVPYQSWTKLRESSVIWDRFLIRTLEKAFCTKEKRERELLLLDAETRYRMFLQEFPGLEDRISQQIIASYLGIKPESLSRIRKRIAS